MYKKLETATQSGSRLDQLKTLAHELAVSIDLACLTEKNIQYAASLAKQYRETIAEIEAIEGTETTDDEISEILQERAADGKSGAVRKNRTGLQAD
jgi:GAF domain-containing protein